jgi:uncharacterized Zn-finger protein
MGPRCCMQVNFQVRADKLQCNTLSPDLQHPTIYLLRFIEAQARDFRAFPIKT